MTSTRIARSTFASLACLAGALVGCAPKLKVLEIAGQTLVRDGKSALIEQEGIGLVATPMAVALKESERLAGLRIELINQSTLPVRLELKDVVLIGADGLRRQPMAPEQFKRYTDVASDDRPVIETVEPASFSVGIARGRPCYPYRYRSYHHYYPYYPYYWDYGPSYYYHRDYFEEEYYRWRERLARFASSLWKTKTIEPGFVANGYVVFEYELRKNEEISVEAVLRRLKPIRVGPPTTTRATTQPLQPTEPGPLTYHFYFGT